MFLNVLKCTKEFGKVKKTSEKIRKLREISKMFRIS